MSAERRRTGLRVPAAIAAGAVVLAAWAPAGGAATGPAAGTGAPAAWAGRHAMAASGPDVQAMVVGREGTILSGPRTVSASATTLRVRSRSCRIAAATPLAALAALRRAGGPGFSMRDYGHCGRRAANSSQLFVKAIAGERNRGQSGWEYKVENVAGSTGAADPSGPAGDGRRIASGARVLWFWCEASSGGCQRTLAVSAPAQATRNGALTVTVYGYDNEGRAVFEPGAVVSLGSRFATTGAHGHATLVAPATRGSYALTAVRRGTVPSFPVQVAIR